MVTTDRISAIFADARSVHADALRLLEAGDIRDAAEKAWCAAKRATDALILARTGAEPEISSDTAEGWLGWLQKTRYFVPYADAIILDRVRCMATASTWASASLWTILSAASARPPTTSTMPSD